MLFGSAGMEHDPFPPAVLRRESRMSKHTASSPQSGSFADKYIAFAEKVSDLSGTVASYLLVPLVIVFLIEIIARNVFNHPTTWAYGTSFIIGGCAAVLGFGYALKNGAMVRIDVFYNRLPEKAKCILDLILYAVVFLPVLLGACYQCVTNAIASVASRELLSTGSWNAPIWPTKVVLALSVIILTMQGLAEVCKLFQRLKAVRKEQGHDD